MDNNEYSLEKDIAETLDRIERENAGKLDYITKEWHKKENGIIYTFEIFGKNEIISKRGIVGKGAKSTKNIFSTDAERNISLQKREDKILTEGFKETKYNDMSVLFTQTQSSLQTKEDDKLFEESDRITEIFDKAIYDTHLGNYMASDFGYGYNILYTVWDEELALAELIKTIEKNKLEHRVLIAKRIYKSEDDWDYEVVFPQGYKGEFHSL